MTDVEVSTTGPDTERQVYDQGRVRDEVRRVGDTVLVFHNGRQTCDPIVYRSVDEAQGGFAVAVMEMLDTSRPPWVVRTVSDNGGPPVMQTMHATMLEVSACRAGHPLPSLDARAKAAYDLLFGHVNLPPDQFWHMCQLVADAIAEVRP